MELTVVLSSGIGLKLTDESRGGKEYPTARLCKGLILVHAGQEMDEEGVGFGVPVVKLGFRTIFSGEMSVQMREMMSARDEIVAAFRMNLVERLARSQQRSVDSRALYAAKNTLAGLYRRVPALRGSLTRLSNMLRLVFRLETIYQEVGDFGQVQVTYTIDRHAGVIEIAVDTTGLSGDGISEVVVMNEQGARWFDRYRDSTGAYLQGEGIGSWDEVGAKKASFICSRCGLAFTVEQVPGVRLLRGRELIGSRLAWAGFGYSFHPRLQHIAYRLLIEKVA